MSYKNNIVVCDGGKRNGMTYGSFKVFNGDRLLYHHQLYFGYGTTNMSEYLALINAVSFCYHNNILHVTFKMDSLLVINQVLDVWKTKDVKLIKLKKIVRKELAKLKSWKLEKIPNTEVKEILGH